MARLRRKPVRTIRVSIRHTDTPTREKCRRVAQALITPELAERGFRLSSSREVCHGHEVIAYEYDITALI